MKEVTRKLDKAVTVQVKDEYHLIQVGEQRGTSIIVAMLERRTSFEPYIVAWDYNVNDGTWSQGHYFQKCNDAYLFYLDYIEKYQF